MRVPSIVRRWRHQLSDAQANRLRLQLADTKDRARLLEQRVAELQTANEAAYREAREATGGARFDPGRPFGSLPSATAEAWPEDEAK